MKVLITSDNINDRGNPIQISYVPRQEIYFVIYIWMQGVIKIEVLTSMVISPGRYGINFKNIILQLIRPNGSLETCSQVNEIAAQWMPQNLKQISGALLLICFKLIPAWIRNYIHYRVWNEIIHAFPISVYLE